MIQQTLTKIEDRLAEAGALDQETRRELLRLVGTLKQEITELSKTDADQAQSIAEFAATSAHEATRAQRRPDLLGHSLGGLAASVDGFEESHPRLVQIVNAISQTLANLGI